MCSLTVVTRPRALTLDSAQKTESTAANTNTPSTTTTTFSSTTSIVITDSTTSSNLTTPVEKHRRHQSENGTHSGLVHGILEALRDEPESKVLSSSNQEEHKDSGAAKDDKEQPPLPIQTESAPVPAAKTTANKAPQRLSINTSTAIIPPRSSSALESGVPTAKTPTDTAISPAATSASSNSLLSPVTPSKKSRRSSNLLGKLVPKFLQTSFAAGSGGGSGSSPRSAHPSTSSLSKASTPLVTRPTRSSTFSGSESTSEAVKNITLPVLPMIPPLILEINEMEICSPDATSPTAVAEPEAYLECLRSDSGIPTPPLSARRSSCSSDVSKRSNLSMVYSMSSVDPTESSSRIEGIAEEKSEDLTRQEKQQLKEQEQEQEQEPAHLPYTIDENCDDDFFLNSIEEHSSTSTATAVATPVFNIDDLDVIHARPVWHGITVVLGDRIPNLTGGFPIGTLFFASVTPLQVLLDSRGRIAYHCRVGRKEISSA
ncbi:hypothetical protein BG006_010233 [Podila minutissima]|uniref:Uncharacterized protein n=1 Tax=Podila minutissima TaxID=64525 RepID=A0A9P5SU94_9FUNG|nr:hypothetical protein BG006_010233 [Podila minutissima]